MFHVVDLHVRGININGEAKWLSLFFSSSPAAFHVCRTKSNRIRLEVLATWFGELRKSPFFKTSDLATFHLTQWEMLFGSWRELQAGRTSWNLLKPNGHRLTGIMTAPEQPCSPASSHGRLSFRPVIVATAHAHALKPFVTVQLGWSCYLLLEQ